MAGPHFAKQLTETTPGDRGGAEIEREKQTGLASFLASQLISPGESSILTIRTLSASVLQEDEKTQAGLADRVEAQEGSSHYLSIYLSI